jgi:MGT family glycosyltransferase
VAKFLFVSYAAAGHLTPTLAVAGALRQRGHDVAVLTAAAALPSVAEQGLVPLATRRWTATLDRISPQSAPTPGIQGLLKLRRSMRSVLFADASPAAEDVKESLFAWPADVVVSGDMTPGVSLAMTDTARPWATLAALITCPLASSDLPPWGAALPISQSALGRVRAGLTRRTISLLLGPLIRDWSAVRAEHRLPPLAGDLASVFASPFLYLIPSSADFDRSRSDLPGHVHYVGPCLPTTGDDAHWENPFQSERPLVYATAGTVHNAHAFLSKLIEASRGENHDLFVTAGKNNDPSAWRDLPPNVRVAGFVPQDLVLRRASAVLCNGGSGAVMGSLVRGRPLVLVPLSADQPENALRCVERGVGLALGGRSLKVEAIRHALRRVLTEPSFCDRARRLGATLSALNGPERAAELLEQLATTHAPVVRESAVSSSAM